MLLKPLSNPKNITLKYVHIQPNIMRLFKCGLDILIYLQRVNEFNEKKNVFFNLILLKTIKMFNL